MWAGQTVVSANGTTHIAMMVGPGALPSPSEESSQARVYHYERTASGPGMFRPWVVDTVAAPDLVGSPGPQCLPVASCLLDETPMLCYAISAPLGQLVVASTDELISVEPGEPSALLMTGPWPNPACGTGRIRISLAGAAGEAFECALFDVAGRRSRTARGAFRSAQRQIVDWDIRGLRPGLYFVLARTTSGSTMATKLTILQ